MTVFSVKTSFSSAKQGNVSDNDVTHEGDTSSSDGLHVDINTASQNMTSVPWFLTHAI